VQFKGTGLLIVTTGNELSCVTTSDAVAVQPFAVSVTVTIYVPGFAIVLLWVVGPLFQVNVVPVAGFVVAVSVSVVVVQVSCTGELRLTTGRVISCVTLTEAEPVQPFAVSVTVTV